MKNQRALVLRSGGTNCDGETVEAFKRTGLEVDLVHLNAMAKDPARLADYSVVTIAGGFSYGDYIAAGRVFGLELRHRLGDALADFASSGGVLLGVCNGFQILVELGLLQGPGVAPEARNFALTDNASNRFECRWVTLRSETSAAPFLVPGELLPVPVAHAEGRFCVRDRDALNELFDRGQVALTYVDPAHPQVDARRDEVPYPFNPNGSDAAIAGICDPTGRVFGLMPHPERNLDPWNHPTWTRLGERTEGEGLEFYRRVVRAAAGEPILSTPISTPSVSS